MRNDWTSVALLFLVAASIGTFAIGAKRVIDTSGLSAPQASVLVAVTGAITIIVGLGLYALSRDRND